MNEELVAFAVEVNRIAIQIVGAAGGKGKAAELALALADRAAVVKQQELMQAEQGATDRFDLSALTVDFGSEAPEREED
jgi:hypothetical protein